MSDTRLRELERRWRSTGSVEDEAAYLLERVRVGDISQEKFEQLAAFDYPAAFFAVHHGHRRWYYTSEENFLRQIAHFGKETLCRSAITCAIETLPAWFSSPLRDCADPRRVLRLALCCVLTDAVSQLAGPLRREADNLEFTLNHLNHVDWFNEPAHTIHNQARSAAQTIILAARTNLADDVHRTDYCVQTLRMSLSIPPASTTRFQAVSRDLSAWALGNDPLPALLARLESEAGA